MTAPTPPRFTVTGYAPHPKAATTWLLHDVKGDPFQVATFLDKTEARAAAVVLSQHADAYDAAIKQLDPYRGAF